jgi:DNA-binding CsgD family transcriptional regulator
MTNFDRPKNIKLTIRELEILKLIAAEHTSQEMAEKLSVSMATIESHRRNMIKKFGVRNSIGIIKVALKNGLISS